MLGAWGGHVVAAAESGAGVRVGAHRRRQVPLAIVMVALTTLTLWSLGQALVVEAPESVGSAVVEPRGT
jgi:glucose uptake protein GlcU